jgi:hypothetical protein
MPTNRSLHPETGWRYVTAPWQAAKWRNGRLYHLGYYGTKEKAQEVETAFVQSFTDLMLEGDNNATQELAVEIRNENYEGKRTRLIKAREQLSTQR